jgi:tetratricopeptide (TPR) repeat protein
VLDTLRRREIVYQREVSAFDSAREFLFKHALLRDVAYDSVLRAHRERYHHRAATWLAEVSATAGRQEEYAAIIAEHFEKARAPEAARWYLVAGRNAASVYALEEATRLFKQALDLAGPEEHTMRFDAHLELERLYDRIGDRALQNEELLAMAALEDVVDEERGIELLVSQSAWAFQHSQYPEALDKAGKASARATELGRDSLVAWAELWRGKACTWSDDEDGASRALERARALSEETGQRSVNAEALRYLGMLAGNAGRLDDAVRLGEAAVEAFAHGSNAEGEAVAVVQLATAYFRTNRYDEARAALERALPIFRRSGHRYREAIALGNLASVSVIQGRFAEAEEWTRKSILVSADLGDRESQATNLTVLGMIESITARYDAAVEHLEESLELARSVGAVAQEADALQRLAIAELGRGEVDAALSCARRSVDVASHTLSSLEHGYGQLTLGYAAAGAALWLEARSAFAAAAEAMGGLDLPTLAREARVGLAHVELAEGDVESAVAIVREVVTHLDIEGLEGSISPGRVLLTCWQVLDAAGDPAARDVLERAHVYLRTRAESVGDDELARGYLAVPVHATLLAMTP